MARSVAVAVVLVSGLIAFGCAEVDNPHLPYPEPDYDEFVASVQPVITDHCAFLACHGTVDRALTFYSVGFLRAGPAFPGTPLQENHLTEAELVWNHDALRIRLLDVDDLDHVPLLLKLIDPDQGGIGHADHLVVFESPSEPGYRAMREWIAGAL